MYMLFNGNAIRIGWKDFIVSFKMFHGEGIVGRGVYRSYYKGHKDKIKGRVEMGEGGGTGWGGVERRGENADNCN